MSVIRYGTREGRTGRILVESERVDAVVASIANSSNMTLLSVSKLSTIRIGTHN